MKSLQVFSAGAAEALLRSLSPQFELASQCQVRSRFGTAGAIAARIAAEEAADVVILPDGLIEKFSRTDHVVSGSAAAVGRVPTAIAVRAGDVPPNVANAATLRTALLEAEHIYAPEWRHATAGIHFKHVLERLGIWDRVEPRVTACPSGAASMKAMAATEGRCIGCAQATEIVAEPGVVLAGYLPDEFKLETVYTAAICRSSADAALARRFVELITGEGSRTVRATAGFL
jgi:molybdate transport system substrate-binding protein